ncbi:ABC transporter substrate-binding protein [Psychrobacillus sp. NPDC096426]|uniref:ABC transporter substrate-binding protein n=1 Tax=Psychrobacillus sp. NPDC096426 TaxID=3364491 RepID=UPI003822A9C1
MKVSTKWIKMGILLMISTILVITGCSPQEEVVDKKSSESTESGIKKEKVLKIALAAGATRLDPQFNSGASDLTISQPIFNGLVRFKPGSVSQEEIEGDLAESWESNPEGTEWTFHLRKGVQWHHEYGEFTSADVKWSFERLLDPEVGSRFQSELNVIESIQAPDPYTVVMQLKYPDSAFLLRILKDGSAGAIVKKEAIEESGSDSMIKPIGTGPFMLKEFKQDEKVVLEKNPEYFEGEPKLDRIEYLVMGDRNAVDVALKKGELHMAVGDVDQLWIQGMIKNADFDIDMVGQNVYWGLFLNTTMEPFDNILVRQAIAHAIDMKTYVEEVFGTYSTGQLASAPIGSELFGYSDRVAYKYNPELSKELLAKAGYPDGLTLPPQFLSARPNYTQMMTYIQEELRKVGITVELQKVDVPTYLANIRENLNGLVLYGRAPKPHAAFAMDDFYYGPSIVGTSTAKLNFSHYNKSDELIEQSSKEMDNTKAKEMYEQIQKEIMDDYVVVPLIETKNILIRRANVELGYDFEGTLNYFYTINEMTDLKE